MKQSFLLIAAVMVCSSGIQAAEVDAEAYIQYRQNLMENAKTHTKGIGNVLKGKLSTKENVVRHARALHEVTMMFPTAFPEGSDFGETSAKEKIWEEMDNFKAAAKKNQDAAAALIKAAESGDMAAIGAAMKDVGKSCKGCHKEFRSKK